jgi:hypothetical protein
VSDPGERAAGLPPRPASLSEASALPLLEVAKLRFLKHGARLRLTVEGDRSYLSVSVVRAFPLSEPRLFLSVRDTANKEIGLIVDPARLDPDNRRLVDAELERRYLVPIVSRILTAKERFGTVDWTMATDRGVCRFTTRNLREAIQRPAPGRFILTDVDGNRYDIQNVDGLDDRSQQLLLRHI